MSETEILSYIYKIVLYYIMKDSTRPVNPTKITLLPCSGFKCEGILARILENAASTFRGCCGPVWVHIFIHYNFALRVDISNGQLDQEDSLSSICTIMFGKMPIQRKWQDAYSTERLLSKSTSPYLTAYRQIKTLKLKQLCYNSTFPFILQ